MMDTEKERKAFEAWVKTNHHEIYRLARGYYARHTDQYMPEYDKDNIVTWMAVDTMDEWYTGWKAGREELLKEMESGVLSFWNNKLDSAYDDKEK